MKKSMFGKAFAFLAAGALIFGAAGCDTGDDSYLPETPTTYTEADAAYAGSGVAAVWNFKGLSATSTASSNIWGLARVSPEVEFPETGLDSNRSIVQADGSSAEGARLIPGGLWNTNTDVLQSKKNTATMSALASAGATLTLELDEQANIVVLAKGAGAAEAARYVAITDEQDNIIISKDNLSSGKDTSFTIKGAAAGTYKIYVNGSSIYYIDLSIASANLKKPAEINELVLYKGDEKAADALDPVELNVETLSLKAMNVYTNEDGETVAEDNTADALWTSSDESVATVKNGLVTPVAVGKTIIRARIGRFYDQRVVEVGPCMHSLMTFFAAENFPAEETVLGTDWTAASVKDVADKLLKATEIGDVVSVSAATITFYDENVTWAPEPTAVAKTDATGDLSQGWDKKLGVKMKPNKYNGNNFSKDFEFAEITFDVTPASGSATIGLSIKARGGKNVNITPTVGSDGKKAVKVGSSTADVSTLFSNVSISEKTTIKVAFSVADENKNGVGFGFQDLVLNAASE